MLNRHSRSVFNVLLLMFVALFAMPVISFGQTFRGGINGTVTDQSGAVLPGATVEATATDTGVSHKTISSSAGAYSFQDMPLGTYTVTVVGFGV